MSELAASRARHPSAGRWRVDVAAAAQALVSAGVVGGQAPHVAAAVAAARGASGVDEPTFAARHGLTAGQLVALEAGAQPVADVPSSLRGQAWWPAATRCRHEERGEPCPHGQGRSPA